MGSLTTGPAFATPTLAGNRTCSEKGRILLQGCALAVPAEKPVRVALVEAATSSGTPRVPAAATWASSRTTESLFVKSQDMRNRSRALLWAPQPWRGGRDDEGRGVEETLTRMEPGEERTVTIPAEGAYGPYEPELVLAVDQARPSCS